MFSLSIETGWDPYYYGMWGWNHQETWRHDRSCTFSIHLPANASNVCRQAPSQRMLSQNPLHPLLERWSDRGGSLKMGVISICYVRINWPCADVLLRSHKRRDCQSWWFLCLIVVYPCWMEEYEVGCVCVDALDSVAWWSYRPVVTICAVSHCYWPSALPLLICISSMSQWRGAMAYGYGNEMEEGRVDG